MAQIFSDELGQSFSVNQDTVEVRGKECLYANIATVNAIASFLKTSLGPTGMDKILVSKDDAITVTNDGATILKEMDMTNNPVSQLVLQLSQAQDDEIGDGTTSIVILAAGILNQAKLLYDKGVHPIQITEGFNVALKLAVQHLHTISEEVTDLNGTLLKAAKTSLGSKIVSKTGDTEYLAKIVVDAALAVVDNSRKDVDLDLINIVSKAGGNIRNSTLVKGIILKKEFSHPQMGKIHKDAKVALLACPFEPPRLKNKNALLIKTATEFQNMEQYEKQKFREMIEALKSNKVDVVLCQWGLDDEANSLLMSNNIPTVRWVGGSDLGLIAAHIDASIVSRFEDLNESKLGVASVREQCLGTDDTPFIIVESASRNKAVSILVRGSTEFIIEECKRSIRDALCACRNIIKSQRTTTGGGSADLSMSIELEKRAKEFPEEEAIKGFAKALLEIPFTLAKNSGYDYSVIEKLKELNLVNNKIGVDCNETGEKDMKKNGIYESMESKIRQITMATDLVNMILKINEVIKIE